MFFNFFLIFMLYFFWWYIVVINDKEIKIEDAINFSNQEELLLKHRKNNMLLSDYQINVLRQNGFDYLKYSNIHDLLFDIEELLNDDYNEELD